MYLGLATMVL